MDILFQKDHPEPSTAEDLRSAVIRSTRTGCERWMGPISNQFRVATRGSCSDFATALQIIQSLEYNMSDAVVGQSLAYV